MEKVQEIKSTYAWSHLTHIAWKQKARWLTLAAYPSFHIPYQTVFWPFSEDGYS